MLSHLLCVGAWYSVLAVVSQLAVVTNALLIAITSNFVGFEVYRRGGYKDEYVGRNLSFVPDESGSDQGLSGYANWSTTEFSLDDLLDGDAFPAYSAQSLEYQNPDGSEVEVISGDSRGTPLYLPFVNFACLDIMAPDNNCTFETTIIRVQDTYNEESEGNVTTFTDDQYERFYEDDNCKTLLFDADTSESPPSNGTCYRSGFQCRYIQ